MSSVSLLKEYFFKKSPVTHLSLSILFVFLFLFRDAIITDDLFLHISKQAVENKDKNYITIIHTKKFAKSCSNVMFIAQGGKEGR